MGAAAGVAAGVAAKDLSAMAIPASEASVSSSGGERLYDEGYVGTREGREKMDILLEPMEVCGTCHREWEPESKLVEVALPGL